MTIQFRGLKELNAKLNHIQGGLSDLRGVTERATKYVRGQIPLYPPAPANSNYRRTGTLGREIDDQVRPIGSGFVGVIGSPTVYAPWVISDEKLSDGRGPQAKAHQGRWWTLQGVLRKSIDGIKQIYNAGIKALLR
jgi:hypothetical protein